MSKIKKITVSNLKALSKLTVDFNGCTAIITGGNNKGKSSFLKSLPDRLRGKNPELVLKHNEQEGFAEWELTTGEKFLWTFDRKKEKLTFITERNIKTSLTKDISAHYFPKIFDVDEFLNSTPKKQKEVLQKLTGIDFTEFDKKYQDAYDDRTFRNKMLAAEVAKSEPIDKALPDNETDCAPLEKELAGIEAHNQKFEYVKKGVDEKRNTISKLEKEIAQLEEKLKALNEDKNAVTLDVVKGDMWMREEKNKQKTNQTELVEKIAKIRKDNEAIRLNNIAKAQEEKTVHARKLAEDADKLVRSLEAEKIDIIKNASMPEGFGFSDEGITYNGYDFSKEQLSSSGIYIAALKLAALTLGDVKALHFDASFLDKNSLADIEKWAISEDLQLLIERPDFEGGEIEYQIIDESKIQTLEAVA